MLTCDISFFKEACAATATGAKVRFIVPEAKGQSTTAILAPKKDEIVFIDEIDHVLIDMVTRFVSNDAKPVIKNGKLHLINRIVGFTAIKEAAFIEAELNFIKAYH